MHDNVCEWVIKIDSRDAFLTFWKQLQSDARMKPETLSRPCLLLAGGGFCQTATDPVPGRTLQSGEDTPLTESAMKFNRLHFAKGWTTQHEVSQPI